MADIPLTRESQSMATLIPLAGLPRVGKTTIAGALPKQIGAVHLCVDSIEAALRRSVLNIHPAEDAGSRVAAALAQDNLALGLDVVADTVSPIELTRRMWGNAAKTAQASFLNVEIVCTTMLSTEGGSSLARATFPDRTFPIGPKSRPGTMSYGRNPA